MALREAMKNPGPDYPIAIAPARSRVTVYFGDARVADSTRALQLNEAKLPVVYYIPRDDVDMSLLERTVHSTHCPYKGDAAYYSICCGVNRSENAIWTYEAPFPAVAVIKDHLAFYPNRVSSVEVRPLP